MKKGEYPPDRSVRVSGRVLRLLDLLKQTTFEELGVTLTYKQALEYLVFNMSAIVVDSIAGEELELIRKEIADRHKEITPPDSWAEWTKDER